MNVSSASNHYVNSSKGLKYDLLWHSPYLEIYLASEEKFLKLIWSGLPDKTEIMSGCERFLEYAREYGCTKVINDVSQIQGLFMDSVDWITTDLGPRLNAVGVIKIAWIYSENSKGRYSADVVLSRSITDTIAIVFDTMENAERWIRAV